MVHRPGQCCDNSTRPHFATIRWGCMDTRTRTWKAKGRTAGIACMLAALVVSSLEGCKLKSTEKKGLGAECTDDADCSSLTCSTTGNVCSKSCTYDRDCGPALVCRRKDDGTGNWCSKAIGMRPNGACMGTEDCDHAQCLKYVGKEDQPGLCTKYCATPDDCPVGMKRCETISDTGLLKVCLPGDSSVDAGARPQFAPAAPKASAAPSAAAVRPRPPPPAAAPSPPPPAPTAARPVDRRGLPATSPARPPATRRR